MNKIKYLVVLSFTSFVFPGTNGGGWLDKWLTIDIGLLLWTILTFMVLLIILKWQAWGPLMSALDTRSKQIDEALNAAKIAQETADQVASDNEDILNQARQESQNIVNQARESGEKLKAKLEQDGQDRYAEMLEKAQEQIDTKKNQALSEIKQVVVNLTIDASEKIIKRNLSSEDNKKMIEKTVDELNQAN
tara:strand:+ start:527 stop:1099 length:573 start_codon:yes stop_codon:yes gene_type:complete